MSKNLFVGVDGKARKAKEFYVGVNGKARRIVKAYIGDENGKARPFWEKESHLGENSLEFVSDDNFSMSATKLWNGTIEYNNGNGWITWNGSQILSGKINGRQRIYFRGSRNTVIRGQNATRENSWKILWSNVECNGNIECLLDYQKVAAGEHPEMGIGCYKFLFYNCSTLITAPQLLATTLVEDCYYYMFSETSITTAPQLPATTLARGCYLAMFQKCSSLTTAPQLPAATLVKSCYYGMFNDCSSLSQVNLPMCEYIGNYTFRNCYSLSQISLPVCKYITDYAFWFCSSLSIMTIGYSSICSLKNSNAFSKTQITSSTGSIYVPTSLVDSYKSANYWSYFSTQIFPISE